MTQRPLNLLVISADGLRYDALHCNGNRLAQTPRLDRLAREGTRFERAYCTQPICMPCRASIMTGRYPWAHGVWQNGVPMNPDQTLLPGVLHEHGYRTATFGKCHFKPWLDSLDPDESTASHAAEYLGDGPYYGFQTATVIDHSGRDPYHDWIARHHPRWQDLVDDRRREKPDDAVIAWKSALPAEATKSRFISQASMKWLDRVSQDERPFFGWVSFDDPHHPYTPSPPFADLFDDVDFPPPPDHLDGPSADLPPSYHDWARRLRETWGHVDTASKRWLEVRRLYQGLVSQVDAEIGRVLDHLQTLGQRQRTVVVFVSDHGTMLGDYGLMQVGEYSQEPLVHIPMIWSAPDADPGQITAGLANTADLLPTLLDYAGIQPPAGTQGLSLRPILQDPAQRVRDDLLINNRHGQQPPAGFRTLVTDQHKLSVGLTPGVGELYDLHADPLERDNLFGRPAHADLQARLTDRMLRAVLRDQDPLPQRTGCW